MNVYVFPIICFQKWLFIIIIFIFLLFTTYLLTLDVFQYVAASRLILFSFHNKHFLINFIYLILNIAFNNYFNMFNFHFFFSILLITTSLNIIFPFP